MKQFASRTAVFGMMTIAIAGSAGVAAAAPTGGTSAADTVQSLQDKGYTVQLNGSLTEPLSQCKVTGVHGMSNTDAAGHQLVPNQFNTAYVDVDCPSDS
jgi:hypothetical protein